MSVDPLGEQESGIRATVERAFDDAVTRLDGVRPSALVAALAALVGALLAGLLLVGQSATGAALVFGGSLGVATYLFNSDRPLVGALGGVVVFPVGVLFAAALRHVFLASSIQVGATAFVTMGLLACVAFAATLAATRAPGQGRTWRATRRTGRVVLAPVLVFLVVVLPDLGVAATVVGALGAILGALVGHLLATPPTFAALTFPLVALVAALTVRRALRRVPIERLVPGERRDRVVRALYATQRPFLYVALASVVALLGVVALAALAASPRTRMLLSPLPPAAAGAVRALVTSTPLRLALFTAVVLGVVALVASWVVGAARRVPADWVARLLAPTLGGVVATVVVAQALVSRGAAARVSEAVGGVVGPLGTLLRALPPFGVAAVLLFVLALCATLALFAVVVFGSVVGSSRATGPALAAVSLFSLALLGVLVTRSVAPLTVGALSLFVWDAGEYAHTLREELDAGSRSLRAELVHLGGSLGFALVVAAVTAALAVTAVGAVATANALALVALLLAVGVGVALLLVL